MPQPTRKLGFVFSALCALILLFPACSPFGGKQSTSVPGATPVAGGSPVVGSSGPGASGAGSQQTSAGADSSTSIVEGGLTEPRTLNPLFVADPISDALSHLVFNGLTRVNPQSAVPEGDLAESWDVSDDGLTYTFHLRDGITWQDGQPFSARDVVFTYQTMMNDSVRSPRYSRLVERVQHVSASDERTVDIALTRADSSFPATLATLGIVPEHLLSGALPEELLTNPFGLSSAVGTGPFILQQWFRGDRIVFQRNAHYFKGDVAVDQYVYRLMARPQDLLAGITDGSIDWAELDPTMLPDARAIAGATVDTLPAFDLSYVALQLDPSKSRLFLDPRVRQALLLALDRDAAIDKIWRGAAQVADGVLPPASWAYGSSQDRYRQDVEQAKKLLDEAGWVAGPDGVRTKDGQSFQFTLKTNGDNAIRRQLADWLTESWRAIGLDARADYEKWSSVRQSVVQTRDFDALLLGYRDDPDPDESSLWSSDSFLDGLNIGHYASADVDDLLDKGLTAKTRDERSPIYAQMQDVVMHDLPVLPLAFPETIVIRSKRLHDARVTAILMQNRANIEQWQPTEGT